MEDRGEFWLEGSPGIHSGRCRQPGIARSPPALPYTLQGAADAPAASSAHAPPTLRPRSAHAPPSPLFSTSSLAFLYILISPGLIFLSCLRPSSCHLSTPAPSPTFSIFWYFVMLGMETRATPSKDSISKLQLNLVGP